ncbi:MAG: sodium:solute symporter family protein [Candidatus Woesearchaeota archaeon]
MQPLDLIIIFAYLIGLFIFAIWIGTKSNLENYLVAGRKFKTFFLVFTMASTMIGMSTVLSTASASYSSGISFAVSGLFVILAGYVVVYFFAKKIKTFGDTYKAHTMGDFFAQRYSNRVRVIAGIVIIVAYLLFFAGLLLGLSQLFQVFGGQGLFISLIFALIGVVIYTAIAGIKSDFYTDIVHFIVMFITLAIILLPWMIIKSGGIGAIMSKLPAGYLNIYNFAGPSFFWLVILFGAPVFLMYMEIWQRIYASADLKTVKRTLLYSALITIPFIVLAVIIGLIGRIQLPGINPDSALLLVIKNYLPTGLIGLAVAGLIATILSTLNTVIMVISAIFIKDFYMGSIKKHASEKHYLKVGRIITFCVGISGIALAYIFPNFVELAVAANGGVLILAPTVIGGFFWKKSTERGAFWSILSGFIVLVVSYPFLGKMSFLPACVVSLASFIGLSLMKKGKKAKKKVLTI